MTDGEPVAGPDASSSTPGARATSPDGAPAPNSPDATAAALAPRRRFGRIRRAARRLWPRGRRGQLAALVMVAGFAVALTAGGVAALQWTETADFCGRCHTMGPELKGHAISAHRELSCAECHVEPGIQGWVKAKINGTRQLIEIIAGTFPTPIPPPGHGDLPPTTATCRRCHDTAALIENGGPIKFVLKNRYESDQANTKSSVALVIRPEGLGEGITTKGIHWHIVSNVEFTSADPRSQSIDVVRVTEDDGSVSQYIAMSKVSDRNNVQADIDRLISTARTSRMDCIDCHNRVGHGVPTIGNAVDAAMEQGQIDPQLPFVKQQSVAILSRTYADDAAASAAIDGLRTYYEENYPAVASQRSKVIDAAITRLKSIYRLVATPDMQVDAQTYPDNIGHSAYPGCFRCHDGGHYKVVAGQISNEAIPSGCATCHTFPQIGANTSAILIGQRPASHLDKLWVFNHKKVVKTSDPTTTECAACHTKTYCSNCHTTPAVQVPHEEMVFNHAAVVRRIGASACTLCHQPPYCAQCHSTPVMPPAGGLGPPPERDDSATFLWPLAPS